ncbi:MAG: AMP-binding protein [Pedococcus sp.]
MQEHVAPPLVEPTTEGSLADLPARNAANNPANVAFSRKEGADWVDVTAGEFNDDVRGVAKGLVAAGITPGDRVAIMCKTRYEWTLTDFAVWTAGGVTVPIYETSSAEQVAWILEDSGASGIMLETPSHQATLDEVRGELSGLDHVWQVDAGAIADLKRAGADVSDQDLGAATAGVDRASTATIIYTSGTTGRPKGVQLTHDNFMALTANAITKLHEVVKADNASTLLFLPLAHVFARFIQILCVSGEAKMGHSADIKNLLADFGDFKPTFILSVPRVFEKIYNSAEAKATAEGKGKIFATAADTAIAWSTAQDTGGVGLGLKLRHGVFDKLVYAKLRAAMGGQVMYAVSGGAPLGTRLGHFFRGIGVIVLEGYGLTETTAPATVNVPDRVKIGTVGAPLPGVGIRIADDGEILIRGNNVFARYHNNDEATASAMEDGWFHTGDIGELDEDGYLKITGRKKEILVTAGGKNVAPAALEDRLRAHPLVSQCIVVGDQKPFIAALLTLDEEMYPGWAKNNGVAGVSFDRARTDETVLKALQDAVDDANKSVSKAESIRKFAVLEDDFTEGNGYLTPSLKLKRNIVMKDFHDQVEGLYSGAKE